MLVGCLSLVMLSTVHADEMSIIQRDYWLIRPDLSEKVDELMVLVEQNDIEKLGDSIQGLAYPQQEAIRFLLLQRLDVDSVSFSKDIERFVAKHRLLAPKYHVIEKGKGFEFLSPAFDYPSVANRLIKEWQREQDSREFISNVKRRQLDLKQWLTGEPELIERHQTLLNQNIELLSQSDVEYLAHQITGPGVISWLPSNQIMTELARLSGNEELYKLLWLMRADLYSEREVFRLGEQNTTFALQQLILASQNPRLKQQAQTMLAKAFPMPDFVRRYLITQLEQEADVNFVARQLIIYGYRSWLIELLSTHSRIKSKQVHAELAR
jgi:hypothetical protein